MEYSPAQVDFMLFWGGLAVGLIAGIVLHAVFRAGYDAAVRKLTGARE